MSVFMNVWPVLKSFPNGHVAFARHLHQGRRVRGQVRCAVRVRNSHAQRGVGIDLAGRDFGVVLLQPALEFLQRLVYCGRPMKNLGRAAPDHGETGRSGALLEVPDVVHQHLGMVHFGALGLQIGSVDAPHIVAVEDGRHGLDFFQRIAQAFNQRLFQHAGVERRFVTVLLENIPTAEGEVFDFRQGHEVSDFGRIVIGALAEPDGVQLCDGADRLRHPQFDGFNAGDEGRRDGAHSRDQNAKLPVGWLNGGGGLLCGIGRCAFWC